MYSPITGTGDGSAPVVNLTFDYLSQAHVKASASGIEVPFTWTGLSQITFSAAVPVGTPYRVYRETPLAPMVDFTDGSVLTEAELDTGVRQPLYRQAETESITSEAAADAAASAAAAVAAVSGAPWAAPYNLLSNTQWEIFSGLTYGPRWKADGTGLLGTASLVSNTATGPETVLTLDAVPSGWKVGDFIKVDPYVPAAGHEVGDYLLPIQNIVGNDIHTTLPRGVVPTGTGTGTVTNMNIGGSASSGTGDAADRWKKSLLLQVWRDDNAANLKHGAQYALGLAKEEVGNETLYYELDITRFRGRQIVFGGRVKHQVKGGSGTYRLTINSDGTGGGAHTSAMGSVLGDYEYLEVTATIPADATWAQVELNLLGALGDTYLFINPMLAYGSYVGSNGYSKPREQLIPVVKVEPEAWINSTIAFPPVETGVGFSYPVDFHADSGGSIARSVRVATGNIEGINGLSVATGTGGSRLIGWVDKLTDPIKLGNFMSQQVQDVKTHQPLRVPMQNGECRVFSGVASDVWSNVSIDFDLFNLE